MVELGAGWGRWIVNGVAALRAQGTLPYHVVGVEAEPTHFAWMKQHLVDNDVDLRSATLIEAAVAKTDGTVRFHVGDAADWYGQAIARADETATAGAPLTPGDGRTVQPVRAVSVRTVLRGARARRSPRRRHPRRRGQCSRTGRGRAGRAREARVRGHARSCE